MVNVVSERILIICSETKHSVYHPIISTVVNVQNLENTEKKLPILPPKQNQHYHLSIPFQTFFYVLEYKLTHSALYLFVTQ